MTDTIWHPDLSLYPGPKYLALHRALREAIRAGDLAQGAQLPTVRDLAFQISVTPGTVSRAYQLATQEGLLDATVGRGTFVAATQRRMGPTQSLFSERDKEAVQGLVDLRSPRLPEVGQEAAFRAALSAVADNAMDWRDYPSQRLEQPLRAATCDWLAGRDLGPITAQDVALCHGGQSAVNLILQCCLRGERPLVLIEDLAFSGFRHAARLARAEVMAVELDAYGLRPDALEAACRKHRPQILCVTTEAQNPTTVPMPLSRRTEIVAIARAHDLQIIEDDCYSIVQSTMPSLRALAPERTWYISSLSKTVSAALRFGYIICPDGMGEAGRLTAQHGFFALSRMVSDLCLALFISGDADRIRQGVQAEFESRLATMVQHLSPFGVQWQEGLPFVWVPLPSGWRASTFARMAEAEGVLVRSADEYALIHGRAPHAVRLAINGEIARPRFDAAIAGLARLLSSPPAELAV